MNNSMSCAVRVAVLIATKNEERNLPHCLNSLGPAHEIVVVDSSSTDRTAEIATMFGATVVDFDPGTAGGRRKRNWALDTLEWSSEWVLIVDADEQVSPGLWAEIMSTLPSTESVGFQIPFKYIFLGRWLKHCGWWPAYKTRLFRIGHGRYSDYLPGLWPPSLGDVEVHEPLEVQGTLGRLVEPIVHHDREPVRNWVDKHNRYSDWEAALRVEQGGDMSWDLFARHPEKRKRALRRLWNTLPMRPVGRFFYMYIVRRGFLDGREGRIFCGLHAVHQWHIDVKAHERRVLD